MKTYSRYLFLLLTTALLFTSCKDDMDDVLPQNRDMLEASEFVYRGLNQLYLYKDKTPELANNYFSSGIDKIDFIHDFKSPEDIFKYLKYDMDRFSVLVDDYVELERALQGKRYSTGASFFIFEHQKNFYLLVRNVLAESNAEKQKVRRGDIFHSINGHSITEENINDLLNSASITLEYAYDQGNDTYIKSKDNVILQSQDIDEPAIAINKVLEIDGHKIGYLMYNSFSTNYNHDLNNVFKEFKQQGVSDLVLDLRYNSGGSVYSAELLSNMITGQLLGKVLYESEWNKDINSSYSETVLFTNKFKTGESIASLGLNRVVILTQKGTASASELVINALKPYINVIQVGTATRGKYQGSILIYDSPDFSKKQLNPMHRYAMLPLVLKIKNSVGYTDFDDGLLPDIPQEEKIKDIKDNLGNPQELLLREGLKALGISLPPIVKEFTKTYTDIPLKRIAKEMDGVMYKDLD